MCGNNPDCSPVGINSLYIGVTENVDERIATHNGGKGAKWTRAHCGARLVYSEPHITLSSARKRELQLKKWSRAKKEALGCGKFRAVEGFESVQINF
jgi:putative endonuclease